MKPSNNQYNTIIRTLKNSGGVIEVDEKNKIIYIHKEDIKLIKPVQNVFIGGLIKHYGFEVRDKKSKSKITDFPSNENRTIERKNGNKNMNLFKLYNKHKHLFESDEPIDRNQFLENVKSITSLNQEIYRANKLQQVSEELGALVEMSKRFNLEETDGWFDGITVNRHNKKMDEAYKIFEKTCNEITQLQQRLEASYEDIVETLAKYYEV